MICPFLGRRLIIIITHDYDFWYEKRSFFFFLICCFKLQFTVLFLVTLKLKIARLFSVMWIKISQVPLWRLPTICFVFSFEAGPPPALSSFEYGCTSSVLLLLLLLSSCASGTSSSMRAILAKPNQFQLLRSKCLCPWQKPSCLDAKLLVLSCGCACVALNSRDKLLLVRDFPLCRSIVQQDAPSEGVSDELLKMLKTKQPYSLSTADWPWEVACSDRKLNNQGPVLALPETDFSLGLWHITYNQTCLFIDFSKKTSGSCCCKAPNSHVTSLYPTPGQAPGYATFPGMVGHWKLDSNAKVAAWWGDCTLIGVGPRYGDTSPALPLFYSVLLGDYFTYPFHISSTACLVYLGWCSD